MKKKTRWDQLKEQIKNRSKYAEQNYAYAKGYRQAVDDVEKAMQLIEGSKPKEMKEAMYAACLSMVAVASVAALCQWYI